MITTEEKIRSAFAILNADYSVRAETIEEILRTLPSSQNTKLNSSEQKHENYYQSCSLNSAEKEVARLRHAIVKMQNHYRRLHATSFISLMRDGFQTEAFESMISDAVKVTDITLKNLDKDKEKYPDWATERTGRPKEVVALQIAKISADEFYQATGFLPTVSTHEVPINEHQKGFKAYGAFLDLVACVFNNLGITASPEVAAREAEDWWKKRRKMLASIKEESRQENID